MEQGRCLTRQSNAILPDVRATMLQIPLDITDPTKGGANICIRVDPQTSEMLSADMAAGNWASRSQYTSMILAWFLEQFRAGSIGCAEIRVLGRRRGRNAQERDAQWQAHDPEIVLEIKKFELGNKLPRHMIGRAAVAMYLAARQTGGAS